MKIHNIISRAMLVTTSMLITAGGFTSCSDDDDLSTDQYAHSGVHLNSFGPSPIERGSELKFIGTNLDRVTSVEIPGCAPITDITVVSHEEIHVTVPQEATPGKVTLRYGNDTIVTQTLLTYIEPIEIEGVSPLSVRPGDYITVTGDYLNLIHEVIFSDGVSLDEESFAEHTRTLIRLSVPEEARTGKIIFSDAAEQYPTWIYSEKALQVTLPSVAAIQELTDVNTGDVITITGSDLDLVRTVEIPSGETVEFSYADNTITFTVPATMTNGVVSVVPASGVKVPVANITMYELPETDVPFDLNFPVDMGTYSVNLECKPGSAFIDAGIQAGMKLNIYMTPTTDYDYSWPKVHLQIFNGHWEMLGFSEIDGATQFNEGNWEDMTKVSILITDELYNMFTTYTDWGYCMILQGNNVKIDRITLQ